MQNERDTEFSPASGFGEPGSSSRDIGFGEAGSAGSPDPLGGPSDAATPGGGALGGSGALGTAGTTGGTGTQGGYAGGELGQGYSPHPSTADEHLTDRAKHAAGDLKERAAEQVQSRIESQKHRAADSLENVAQSLRTASRQMPEQDGLGRYMERAATQVDNLAAFLNNREVADLFDEMEGFARRQPAVFLGGAFALGVLGARFLKSSRRNIGYDRYDRFGQQTGWSGYDPTGRVDDPTRDYVTRPGAAGYVPPDQRDETDFRAPGSF